MKNFVRLNKNEMKMVMGGTENIGDCQASTCASSSDCTEPAFPYCYIQSCNATGLPANFCGVAKKTDTI
jgi:hypothetical protein